MAVYLSVPRIIGDGPQQLVRPRRSVQPNCGNSDPLCASVDLGSRYGVRRACAGMIGVLLSDLFLIVAVALGLSALLAASEFWFSMLKYLGTAYLAYLGIKMIRSAGRMHEVISRQRFSVTGAPDSIGLKSFWAAATNSKAYLFFSALFPLFIDTRAPLVLQYFMLALGFFLTEFAVILAYAIVGLRARRYFKSSGVAWLERACGGALLAMAASVKTMLSGRTPLDMAHKLTFRGFSPQDPPWRKLSHPSIAITFS
jgi:threonine/homoserine/homoserine lactone efflux protein